jgi:hypothetical protein
VEGIVRNTNTTTSTNGNTGSEAVTNAGSSGNETTANQGDLLVGTVMCLPTGSTPNVARFFFQFPMSAKGVCVLKGDGVDGIVYFEQVLWMV